MIHVKPISNPTDLAQAFDIRRRVFVIEQECPPDEEYDEFESTSSHYLVTHNGIHVGTCRHRTTDKGFKLERFAVLKEHRTSGVGAALLNHCLNTVRPLLSSESPIIYLHAQEHALKFYEKYGFVAQGDRFFEAGIPHFKMVFSA